MLISTCPVTSCRLLSQKCAIEQTHKHTHTSMLSRRRVSLWLAILALALLNSIQYQTHKHTHTLDVDCCCIISCTRCWIIQRLIYSRDRYRVLARCALIFSTQWLGTRPSKPWERRSYYSRDVMDACVLCGVFSEIRIHSSNVVVAVVARRHPTWKDVPKLIAESVSVACLLSVAVCASHSVLCSLF